MAPVSPFPFLSGEDGENQTVIQIKDLGPQHVGRWVDYHDDSGKIEVGKIKSWNDQVVFVVYRCNNEWHRFKEFTAAATNPADLTFR